MRIMVVVILACTLAGRAEEPAPQVDWIGDWEVAFKTADETGKPVMVCINGLDGEAANERAAKGIYRDPLFVALSRAFVMVVVSAREHAESGPCPRFGKVSCEQHVGCWHGLRDDHGAEFLLPDSKDEMISPQHAWFRADGTLLFRKPYEMGKRALLERMRNVLVTMGFELDEDFPPRDPAPLAPEDVVQLERFRTGDSDTRKAALERLTSTNKRAVHDELLSLLGKSRDRVLRCDVLRGLGRAWVHAVRPVAEKLLQDKQEEVRSCAAYCLECLADRRSVPVLARRLGSEPDAMVRRNLCRALGVCGGPGADKKASRALLKALRDDGKADVRKHAALGLACFAGPGAKLVRSALEKAVAREKDWGAQCAIVYALTRVGDGKKSVRVLTRVREKTREDWKRKYLDGAIATLNGEKCAFNSAWLFSDDRNDPARRG